MNCNTTHYRANSSSVPGDPTPLEVPDDLSERDQWLLWRYETRNGKSAKIPYQVSGRLASSTDPRTWETFEAVFNAWSKAPKRYGGLGSVFCREDPFCGVDLDDSLDELGNVKPWAQGIVERFADTYCEVSTGGQGLKLWARGALPANLPGVKVGDGQIEIYDHSRYFAVTGREFRGSPLEIQDHAADSRTRYDRLTQNKKRWKLEPLEGRPNPLRAATQHAHIDRWNA